MKYELGEGWRKVVHIVAEFTSSFKKGKRIRKMVNWEIKHVTKYQVGKRGW